VARADSSSAKSAAGGPSIWRAALDWFLLTAVLYVAILLAQAANSAATLKAQQRIVRFEAHELFRSFEAYHERNRSYPNAYAEPGFDSATLDPLAKRGYYRGNLLVNLRDQRIDAYGSPDDRGPNREFWVEMSLKDDPTIRVVVARSDDAPLGGGKWLDGVFVFRDGVLEPF
jgi:hypothetical protein